MRDTSLTLLERLRNGRDELAWQDFLSRYWRPLYMFARGRGCSEETAEEVVQETVLAVFEHAATFRYEPKRGLFRNWLFTIAIRKLAMMRRGEQHGQKLAEGGPDEPAAPEERSAERQFDAIFENGLLAAMTELVRSLVSSWRRPSTRCALSGVRGPIMRGEAERFVFHCVVFAQAIINPDGPAGACLELARNGAMSLYISDYLLSFPNF